MQVVLNRARLRKQSICDVVKSPHQFAWYHKGMELKVDENTLTTYNEVSKIDAVVVEDVEWFHSGKKPSWSRKMKLVCVVGRHKFYSEVK